MRILTFHQRLPFSKVVNELTSKVGVQAQRNSWTHYHDISCLCVQAATFEKYEKHFLQYSPIVEENATVRVHAEQEDEIPWGVKYVRANRYWSRGKGQGIRIAVIDTGISRTHFELRDQIKGGVRLVKGPINGHGTHVAGIIVAEMNHRGIVGVSPGAHLYDVKAFDANGTASLVNIIKGIEWSVRNQMDIINMSFGMPGYSEALARMVNKAASQGIVMVASAGNNSGAVEYPARYPGVIGVGALNQDGKLADFSSRGRGMNVVAPGVDILSTWPGNRFKTLNGTSMAAPHITGLTALRMSAKRGTRNR